MLFYARNNAKAITDEEIIKYIADSEKKTPVKLYVKEKAPI